MKQQIISLLERAKENGTTIGDVLAEVRGMDSASAPDEALSEICPIHVGGLTTVNQEEYPGLGDWFVQLRIGQGNDEVLARVYGASPDQARSRAQALACASRPAAPAASAEPVAWMDPETKDVITQHRKFEWERFFGEGGKRKAESYTVELTYAATPAAAERAQVAGEAQKPVAYRAWFDQDNGARWLFTLWPEEERLDVQWEPLYAAPQASPAADGRDAKDADVIKNAIRYEAIENGDLDGIRVDIERWDESQSPPRWECVPRWELSEVLDAAIAARQGEGG